MSGYGLLLTLVALVGIGGCAAMPLQIAGGPAGPLMAVGYYVDYDPNSRATVESQGGKLNWIITTNYEVVNSEGTIQGTHDPAIVAEARKGGSAVHFRLANQNFDRTIAHEMLTNPAAQQRVQNGIIDIITTHGYDGVNIDLENVAPADRAALNKFITDLSGALSAAGKTLSMAVPPKIVDNPTNDWNGAFDYAVLGHAADSLVIMAYDEHWSGSAPGPVASLPWVEAAAQFALNAEVAPHKILLGVPFYGYDWPSAGSGEGISMRTALSRAAEHGAAISWDELAEAPFFRYPGHTVHFEDTRSVERKLKIAYELGLAGVAAWRLGHEVPDIWNVMAPYLSFPGR